MSEAADRWRRVDALCQAALDLPEAARDAFLLSACGDDADVCAEVRALLAHAPRAEQFLDAPLGAAVSALAAMSRSLTGTRIGAFEVGALIGSGGMGDVYRARDTRLQREVALKMLPLAFALDPGRLDRFRREAQALASLNHPNIGAIYGFEASDGVYALVLELVDGPTLADRLAQGPLQLAEAVPAARQMAEGLESAHERGIVHNDFKPQNVVLRRDGTVKVLDFGLATMMGGDAGELERSVERSAPSAIGDNVIFGTRAYASPEQWHGTGDKRSDIWAFGAVLFEMVSGRPAFTGAVDAGSPPVVAPDLPEASERA